MAGSRKDDDWLDFHRKTPLDDLKIRFL